MVYTSDNSTPILCEYHVRCRLHIASFLQLATPTIEGITGKPDSGNYDWYPIDLGEDEFCNDCDYEIGRLAQ